MYKHVLHTNGFLSVYFLSVGSNDVLDEVSSMQLRSGREQVLRF